MPDLSNTGETVVGSDFMRRDGGVRFPKPSAVDSFVAGATISTNAGKTFGTNDLVSGVRIKADPANAEATVKMIVQKYTDDGMLAPSDD